MKRQLPLLDQLHSGGGGHRFRNRAYPHKRFRGIDRPLVVHIGIAVPLAEQDAFPMGNNYRRPMDMPLADFLFHQRVEELFRPLRRDGEVGRAFRRRLGGRKGMKQREAEREEQQNSDCFFHIRTSGGINLDSKNIYSSIPPHSFVELSQILNPS
ncbi:hypothetical protein D1872_237460 [compost metagenome]